MDLSAGQLVAFQELLDRQAIRDVLARYARGCDRVAPELMASVYHEDSWDFHGVFEGPGAELASDEKRQQAHNVIAHHALCQMHIELDGDVARCETYYIASGIREYETGRRVRLICGRYLDRFERRDGVWKIAVRRALVDYSQETPEGPIWPPEPSFTKGARWPTDPNACRSATRR